MPHHFRLACLLNVAAVAAACAGPGLRSPTDGYSEQSWSALAADRPEPRPDAPGIAIERVAGADGILESVGMAELVLLRFLNRRDVRVVDRRRFSLAAARARQGLPRPPAAPPRGDPPEIEFVVRARLEPSGEEGRVLELRLVEAETERILGPWRDSVPADATTVTLARAVGTLLERALVDEELLAVTDPDTGALHPGEGWSGASVRSPEAAFRAFMEGVVAEDRYNWTAARAAYTRACSLGGPAFVEPRRALGRVARLRTGATPGGS